MAKLVSKTYGEALYEIAVEEGKTDIFLEETETMMRLLAENPDFNKLMNHPKVSKENKEEVIQNVFKGNISEELTGFLLLLIRKERYGELEAVFRYFIDKVKAQKGIGIAYVTSAMEITGSQKARIEERLLVTTRYKQMEMHYKVDRELIGGMVIRIGDRVVDSSIRTKLENLARKLYQIQLQ